MKKKVALIFGITGQDGSYLAELLLKKNYIVNGVKRRSSSMNTSRVDHIYQDPHEKNYKFRLGRVPSPLFPVGGACAHHHSTSLHFHHFLTHYFLSSIFIQLDLTDSFLKLFCWRKKQTTLSYQLMQVPRSHQLILLLPCKFDSIPT